VSDFVLESGLGFKGSDQPGPSNEVPPDLLS